MMAYSTDRVAPLEHHRQPTVFVLGADRERLDSLCHTIQFSGIEPRRFLNPEEMLQCCRQDEVGCIISPMLLPRMGGLELRERLTEADICLSLILTLSTPDVPLVVSAMKRGATSVLLEPVDANTLIAEIHQSIEVSERACRKQRSVRNARRSLERLSGEESAVLNLATEGVPNREIAIRLAVSPRTVDRRRQSALQKLGAESITEFAILKTLAGM
ncbi:MAG: LuxR C-terminal-related transcriptional regulator [Planctomycetota bacterium]